MPHCHAGSLSSAHGSLLHCASLTCVTCLWQDSAPSASAQVQIYPQDSEHFVSLSSPYSGACLPPLHSVAMARPAIMLLPVHLGAFYKA
ncbi:hypothetical protein Nmel_000616 [Mimus melanotis]